MIYILVFIAILYSILIIAFTFGFDKLQTVKNKKISPKNKFSIIIPFRNEAKNLPNLLASLYSLNYPFHLFEVFLINDNSSDNYLEVINGFTAKNGNVSIRILQGSKCTNSPKKEAINLGLKYANFNWIVTTDADCIVPKNWLQLFNQHIEEKNPSFISAPVKFIEQKTFLFHFQNLHFISLLGSTIGSFGIKKPFMCNGANLCYNKVAFNKVKGFEGNTKIASGDDIFLLEKMKIAFPTKVSYLKSEEAIVKTKAQSSWSSFFNQQIRWASKSTAYKSNFSKFVGITVFMLNFVLVISIFSTTISLLLWKYVLGIVLFKLLHDFILIVKTSIFIGATKSLKYYLIISLLYPFFIVIIGGLSLFKSYKWKGRVFKK